MEQINETIKLLAKNGLSIDDSQAEQLNIYVDYLYTASKKFNLIGYKGKDEIWKNVVINSIKPVRGIDVPRGTSILDIGTGSGVPGIALSIYYQQIVGNLVDSNSKRIDFVNSVLELLGREGVTGQTIRLGDVQNNRELIEQYDIVLSRAMGNIYATLELSSQYIKVGGKLYIYSNIIAEELYPEVVAHGRSLSLNLIDSNTAKDLGYDGGLLFEKQSSTDARYPRRFPVIKRESNKFDW